MKVLIPWWFCAVAVAVGSSSNVVFGSSISDPEFSRRPRSFGDAINPTAPASDSPLPYLVDFDELNALASTFDEYPSPEDILHSADDQPVATTTLQPIVVEDMRVDATAGQISASATAFRKLVHVPEASSNGYVYAIPDNPIQLPMKELAAVADQES